LPFWFENKPSGNPAPKVGPQLGPLFDSHKHFNQDDEVSSLCTKLLHNNFARRRRAGHIQYEIGHTQGYQMVYFQTKNPILGIFWRVLVLRMLVFL
jgi:hypothetical protein